MNLEGGWLDAGDFIKFTHTIAYADVMLFASERAMDPAAPPALAPEARFGLRFLRKAWNPRTGVLALQVGIGSGNKAGTFSGDHDVWRLPQRDDALTGARNRYLRRRPAFRANDPGTRLPPNLAGRVSAAFALAAQVDAAGGNPARAAGELDLAAQIFAAARTVNIKPADVVTALPHAFYPESSWRDDMELGAAELALAGQALGDPRTGMWLKAGKIWAPRVPRQRGGARHAQPLRHERAGARRPRAGAAHGAQRLRAAGPPARRRARAARARRRPCQGRSVRRRRDLRRLRRRAAHLRTRRDGAALPGADRARRPTTPSRRRSATGRSVRMPGASR